MSRQVQGATRASTRLRRSNVTNHNGGTHPSNSHDPTPASEDPNESEYEAKLAARPGKRVSSPKAPNATTRQVRQKLEITLKRRRKMVSSAPLDRPLNNSPSPIPQNQLRRPTEATSRPGIFTDAVLSSLHLGLLVGWGCLYCLECKPSDPKAPIGIAYPNIAGHLLSHHNISTTVEIREAIELVQQYGVWNGNGLPPVPSTIVPPFPFLKTMTSENSSRNCPAACIDCCETEPFIWTRPNPRTNHYRKVHNRKGARGIPYEPINAVQSFHSHDSYVRWFEVDLSLAPGPTRSIPPSASTSKSAMAQAYLTAIRREPHEAISEMPSAQGLTRENPFLHRQGWPRHLEQKDPEDLVSLVEQPKGDALLSILNQAGYDLYDSYQSIIRSASPQILRMWLDTDAHTSKYIKCFNTILDSGRRYAGILVQFISFILRTYLRIAKNAGGNTKYTAFLTPDQSKHAKKVWGLATQAKNTSMLRLAMHDLAVTCFAPNDPALMTMNRFNNIVHVFIMLKSVLPNGSYRASKDLVFVTTAIQYSFRAVLLKEAFEQSKRPGALVPATFEKYQKFLVVTDMVSPFGDLKTVRKQMKADAETTRGLGQLHWADKAFTSGSLKGHSFVTNKVQTMSQVLLDRTENLMFDKVLFGISLDKLGYIEPDLSRLQDVKSETKYNYSMWNDKMNVGLISMRSALLNAFIKSEESALEGHFYEKALPNGQPAWFNGARKKWLEVVGDFSLHLLGCTHLWGGQLRRAKEITNMRNHNVESRLRSVFLHFDLIIFILGYSKTTAITGMDRMDVHALPPRLTRLFFIYLAFVRPAAVQWLKEITKPEDCNVQVSNVIQDDEDSDEESISEEEEAQEAAVPLAVHKPRWEVQDEYTFCSLGRPFTSEDLSRLLRKYTSEFLGVSWGISPCRHLYTAIQRDVLKFEFEEEEIEPGERIQDWQAGHSTQVARAFYAVRQGDWNLTNSDSVNKYVEASKIMHTWLRGEEHIREETIQEKILSRLGEVQAEVKELRAEVKELKAGGKERFSTEKALSNIDRRLVALEEMENM